MRRRWYFLFVPIRVALAEYLTFDGVMRVKEDGVRIAEHGCGALLGELTRLEGAKRTSSLVTETDCRVESVPAKSVDCESLQELSAGLGREDSSAGGTRARHFPRGSRFNTRARRGVPSLRRPYVVRGDRPRRRSTDAPARRRNRDSPNQFVDERRAVPGLNLLSHLHWDHVQGLPFCDATDRNDARVTLFVPDQLDGSDPLEVLSRSMSPPHFPVRADELRGDWSFLSLSASTMEVEGFSVLVEEIPHKGGRTYGVRVSDGSSTVVYMTDHCPSALGPGPDGLGEYHQAALSLCEGADVLIHDAQLAREELEAETYFGHAAAENAVELARHANVAHVVLFHHKQGRVDDDLDALAGRFSGEPRVTVATQRTVLEL